MFRNDLIQKYLNLGFEHSDAASEIDFICSIVFNLSPVDLLLEKNIPPDFYKKLSDIVDKRLMTKRPIQQIVGMGYFLNEKYIVNENVLSPRPETELLVLKAKEIIDKNNFKNFLDIGCGTGCISIALLKLCPKILGTGSDISKKALDVAKQNAVKHNVTDRLTLLHSDLFSDINAKFDIIISNPPYISLKEKPSLQEEVRCFEPELALFTNDDDGVDMYKKIISDADKFLNKDGYLIFEIGCNQGQLVQNLFEKSVFKQCEIIKDLDNKDRIVIGRI